MHGAEHILTVTDRTDDTPDERKKRYLESCTVLKRAFALSVPHEDAIAIRDDVGYMLAVAGRLSKVGGGIVGMSDYDMEAAIAQLVSRAVVPQGVIDIFAEAGIDRPDICLLSEEFLEEVRHLPQRNLAAEALQRLLMDQIRVRMTRNAVEVRKFSELLEASIRRYQNRTIEAAQVILELIELAREMRESAKRGEELGLSEEELAFYDALAENESAVEVLGDQQLRIIATELVRTVRNNATIDWTIKNSVKARLGVLVRRALRKYGYPPDLQEAAVQNVLQQAELFALEQAA